MSRIPNDGQPPPYTYVYERSLIAGVHAPPSTAPQYNNPTVLIMPGGNSIYRTRSVMTTTRMDPPETFVITGVCPVCGNGFFEDYYPCIALFCAICFFPFGILCCLAMKCKRCVNCGYVSY